MHIITMGIIFSSRIVRRVCPTSDGINKKGIYTKASPWASQTPDIAPHFRPDGSKNGSIDPAVTILPYPIQSGFREYASITAPDVITFDG